MNKTITNKIKNSPNLPGVYIFFNKKENIYIGKANNLKQRLKAYLNNKIRKNQIIDQYSTNIKWIIVNNETEALLLESKLIKKHQPKVNIILKDNKSYFFVKITNETFPKVLITHNEKDNNNIVIGPFTSGTHLKILLKLLRQIFPYCTCIKKHKKPCLNSQINLCPGYCCVKDAIYSKEDIKNYQQNIKNLINVLTFNNKKIIKSLKLNIEKEIKKQNFEQANNIKKQIMALNNLFKHQSTLQIKSRDYTNAINELTKLFNAKKKIKNIEMYDVSNISGKFATASLVFFSNGYPAKEEYKKFKIKYTKLSPNDILMLKEVFNRRINNIHWAQPDLIIIDGGIAQINAAIEIFSKNKYFKNVNIGSLAKGKKQFLVYKNKEAKYFNLKDLSNDLNNMLISIQNESHRFAVSYHHKLYLKQIKNDL
jgi:excinuclease ABC subunit C